MSVRRISLLLALCACFALSQDEGREPPRDPKLPDGRSQREEILRAEHRKSLADAGELIRLSEDLRIDLEKNDRYVVSVGTLKKLDEMEKLVKRIRGRLKRF